MCINLSFFCENCYIPKVYSLLYKPQNLNVMQNDLHTKIKLLKCIKKSMKTESNREKLINSSSLTHFVLCLLGNLEIEVADRVTSKDEMNHFTVNNKDWVFKRK